MLPGNMAGGTFPGPDGLHQPLRPQPRPHRGPLPQGLLPRRPQDGRQRQGQGDEGQRL